MYVEIDRNDKLGIFYSEPAGTFNAGIDVGSLLEGWRLFWKIR